ncbi:MAG: tripartite tricarboxylate transporter substrate binding protein [Burkholderiales bacterium]|jgi:tripartite-type tricarboxylate transporter receptor subunit TctC|nr:tripartite tricarboxylate transporter substrate binding protein [Burkholderiales bacterium]
MSHPRRLFALLGLSLTLACSAFNPVRAQDAYPNKPIKVVVPFPAGGATDILTRAITEKLAVRIGQSVIIENRPGAGANIGAATVAKAPPDGYTILMGSIGSHSISVTYHKDPGYSFKKDLMPISSAGSLSNIVVIGNDVPAKNLQELVAYAKANPGKLTCGSSGTGGLIHLTCEMFKIAAGIDVLHVPYKGTSLLMPDLISGRVTMALDTLPPYMPMLKDGRVRALAITTATRSSLVPDLPTIAESGYPGFESVAVYGFFAPTGTPTAIIKKLNADINAVLLDPDLKDKLLKVGIEVEGSTPEALAAFVDKEIAKWAAVIKAGNIKSE